MESHFPRRRFAQHFLVDRHYIERILDAVNATREDRVVEIGPGLGALTQPMLDRVERLTVIEIDRDLAAKLAADYPSSRLDLRVADALSFDFATLGERLRVIGNLPYNISSPLLFHLAQYEAQLRDITVMLQKEVVARMTASPATPEYGRLSVMLSHRAPVRRSAGGLPSAAEGRFGGGKADSARRAAPAGRRPCAVRSPGCGGVRTAAQDAAQCAQRPCHPKRTRK